MNGEGYYREIGPAGSKEPKKQKRGNPWHKHRAISFGEAVPEGQPEDSIEKVGETLYLVSKKRAEKAREELIAAEQAKLGRDLTDDEKIKLLKEHFPKLLKEMTGLDFTKPSEE